MRGHAVRGCRMKSMKRSKKGVYDWRQPARSAANAIHLRGGASWQYYSGHVATRLGYVVVYSEGGIPGSETLHPSSQYRAIIDGVEYSWSEPVARTPRGLATMAGKFITRLVREVGQ